VTSSSKLPFVFSCPASEQEVADLLEEHDGAEIGTILNRVLACHSVHLHGRNRSKIEV
jgi:hypothetical protein